MVSTNFRSAFVTTIKQLSPPKPAAFAGRNFSVSPVVCNNVESAAARPRPIKCRRRNCAKRLQVEFIFCDHCTRNQSRPCKNGPLAPTSCFDVELPHSGLLRFHWRGGWWKYQKQKLEKGQIRGVLFLGPNRLSCFFFPGSWPALSAKNRRRWRPSYLNCFTTANIRRDDYGSIMGSCDNNFNSLLYGPSSQLYQWKIVLLTGEF